jgi:hypothetical protein
MASNKLDQGGQTSTALSGIAPPALQRWGVGAPLRCPLFMSGTCSEKFVQPRPASDSGQRSFRSGSASCSV